jgi:hypothetical protein
MNDDAIEDIELNDWEDGSITDEAPDDTEVAGFGVWLAGVV